MAETYIISELKVESSIEFQQIEFFKMVAQINDHASFSLKGVLRNSEKQKNLEHSLRGERIKIYVGNDREDILCHGVITSSVIQVKGDLLTVQIDGSSASIEFDIERKMRIFQNGEMRYKELLDSVAGSGQSVLYINDENRQIEKVYFQCEETDWEFIRRITGELHTVLVPDLISGKCKVACGCPGGKRYEISDELDLQIHMFRNDNRIRIAYIISLTENIQLGEQVVFGGKEGWRVVKKSVLFSNGNLVMDYTLGRLEDYAVSIYYNHRIQGRKLVGTVISVKKELLKLRFDEDDSKDLKVSIWYPYLPETGNMMYAMPETGSKAVLYFPNEQEIDAMVIFCFHNDLKMKGHLYPQIKELTTAEDKIIRLVPEGISFRCDKIQKGQLLNLIDMSGIQCSSGKKAKIKADGKIKFLSGVSTSVSAQSFIGLYQSDKPNHIEISAAGIIYQAERFIVSSRVHKNKDRKPSGSAITNSNMPELYPYLAGMMAVGDAGDINQHLLASIPSPGWETGNSSITKRIGLKGDTERK